MPLVVRASDEADQLAQQQNRLLGKVGEAADASVAQSRLITTCMIGLSLLVGLVIVFIVRQINQTLRRATSELSEGAQQVASAASEVSASSQSLAQGSSEQAASLEETSASTEEIGSMTRRNSESARSAANLVTQSAQKFAETNKSLQLMVQAMGEINASSDKISKIIKVIDEIAFQTNILALNAAVEAARAGDAGMGFAVVADEVRNLAQPSAQAAKDTAALIEDSIATSNEGRVKVDEVASAIHALTEESARVKILVEEVSVSSQEQTRGVEQIGKAMTQMEQVTQTIAANAEESASAAEELNAQSESLNDVVRRLAAMTGGVEAAPAGNTRRTPRSSLMRKPFQQEVKPSLSALRTAVSRQVATPGRNPAMSEEVFPLEQEFQEF